MKTLISVTSRRRLPLACILTAALALASCGGGGGGTSAAPAAPNTIVASFVDIVPGINFSWSTAQQSSVKISVKRASGAALGDLRVVLSDYLCDDPTGGAGLLPNPVRTSAYLSYALTVPPLANEQGATAATLDLSALQIPASRKYVLVEVFDDTARVALYGQLVKPTALGALAISLPGPDAVIAGSCANPG